MTQGDCFFGRGVGDTGKSVVLEYPSGSSGFPWHNDHQSLDRAGKPIPPSRLDPHLAYELASRTYGAMALLTDGSEYEGGDLLVRRDSEVVAMPRERGTVIVFPSDTEHSVTPVEGGTRRCCVNFFRWA